MEKLVLNTQVREHTGSTYAEKIRKLGRIPAVVYGHKKTPLTVSVNAHDFTEGLHHGHRLMDLKLGKKNETVIVKDIQYDHLGKNIIHADLMRVRTAEKVTVTVPIELKGTAKGTHEGGIVVEQVDRLEIECKVTQIPENIVVSVKEMGVGDHIFAKDVEMPEGVKLVSDPDTLILTCSLLAAAKTTEEVEAEEPVAPEIIGKEEEPEEKAEEEK